MTKEYDVSREEATIDLALNEFYGNDDLIGLFPTEPATDRFLSIENIE